MRVALILVRCVFVALLLSAGFGGLAYLSALQRVATRALQGDPEIGRYAFGVGVACLAPFCLAAMIAELQLALLLSGRWSWAACMRLLPWSFAVLGGAFAFMIFQPAERGPKETMLVMGGALTAFLASLTQLSLHWDSAPQEQPLEWPVDWSVALILMGAAFLGAMKGWTGPSREFREVLTYHDQRWPDGRRVPETKLAPIEESPTH